MDFYKLHEVDAQELKKQLLECIKKSGLSLWGAAASIRIDKRSMDSFLVNPERSKYRTANLIANWINNQQSKLNGQESL